MKFEVSAGALTELSPKVYHYLPESDVARLGGPKEFGVMRLGGPKEFGVMRLGGPKEFGVMTPLPTLGKAA